MQTDMFFSEMNILSVFAAACASMAVGFAWYSKQLFGSRWTAIMRSFHVSKSGKQRGMAATFVFWFMSVVVMAYVLAVVFHWADVQTIAEAAATSVLLWLGFVATALFVNTLYKQQTVELFLIDSGYHLVSLVLMGIILTLWV